MTESMPEDHDQDCFSNKRLFIKFAHFYGAGGGVCWRKDDIKILISDKQMIIKGNSTAIRKVTLTIIIATHKSVQSTTHVFWSSLQPVPRVHTETGFTRTGSK